MKPAKGYYSLIQYCPDLSRLEAANIGVLLFCPDKLFLQARTARGNNRIQRFFGREGHDWDRIDSFKLGVEERLAEENGDIKTLEDLERFIALRANELQITPPRPVRVEDDPRKTLEDLFQELVRGQHRQQRGTSFKQFLDQKLKTPALKKKVKTDFNVVVHVLNRQIDIPYGFQNGRFNLIQPARFRGEGLSQAETTACKYAIEGRSLYDHPDKELGNLQLIIVGEFGGHPGEKKIAVERILQENRVKLYAANEVDSLVDEIKTTGKDIAQEGK
jgi:hypothetical protein